MKPLHPFAFVVLASLTACADPMQAPSDVDGAAASRAAPGYFALGARLTETDANGEPRFRLEAERVEQAPGSDRIRLVEPRFDVATARGAWQVRSASGELPEDASRIRLEGDVRLTSRVGARLEPIEIRTAALAYDPRSAEARSEADVSIVISGKSLEARGLVANLKAQTVRLESSVHGRFTP